MTKNDELKDPARTSRVGDIFQKPVREPLTQSELVEKAIECAKAYEDLSDLEESLADAKLDYKRRRAVLNEEIRTLHYDIATGREWRSIDCRLRLRFAEGVVDTVRVDSGEVVESRPMNEKDRQTAMRI